MSESIHQHWLHQQSLSDEQLVNKALAGEAMAFEVIIRRHNQLLYRLARSAAADDATAQDIVQEAYIKAFNHLDSFKQQAQLKTWLGRIVMNTAMDFQRKQRQYISFDDNVVPIQTTQETIMPNDLSDKHHPEQDLNNQQMQHILQQAIGQLPETYRSVFVLRAVEEMSVADTALCLDLSQDTVKTRFLRARKLLQDDLQKQWDIQAKQVFEFAGKRCDTLTHNVLVQLTHQGLIKSTP